MHFEFEPFDRTTIDADLVILAGDIHFDYVFSYLDFPPLVILH